jgi:ATP-dependent RNA helicase RhlB
MAADFVPRSPLGRQAWRSRALPAGAASPLDSPGPTVNDHEVSTDTPQPEGRPFASFDLPEPVMQGIRAAGFTHCTPIQEKVLPLSLAGKDVAGQAQTGTGKTAAFLITIFTRLLRHGRGSRAQGPRAFVIAPTRELVVQITDDARLLGQATGLTVHAVYGGVDYKKQRDQLVDGVDLLVGTPGRLIDYHRQHALDLRHVEMLVIDEADRMFDMGFIKDLRYLLRRLPPFDRRQSMLFSATLNYDVMELAYVFMNEAEKVSVTPEQVTAENIEHLVYHVGLHEKLPLLVGLLRQMPEARVLVFTNMKRTAERLERNLVANGFSAAAITGDVDQRRRLRILADFKDGTLPILVATDVASRGLHIDGVTHVINYDLPFDAEDYVHRAGRTARAGASGHAVTLACEEYVDGLEAIEHFIGFKLPHDFPDDSMLAHDMKHPPRHHREDGDRRRGGPGDRRPRRGGAGHPPSHPSPKHVHDAGHARAKPTTVAAPAAAGSDAAKKRRRRRRRRSGAAAPTPAL